MSLGLTAFGTVVVVTVGVETLVWLASATSERSARTSDSRAIQSSDETCRVSVLDVRGEARRCATDGAVDPVLDLRIRRVVGALAFRGALRFG